MGVCVLHTRIFVLYHNWLSCHNHPMIKYSSTQMSQEYRIVPKYGTNGCISQGRLETKECNFHGLHLAHWEWF